MAQKNQKYNENNNKLKLIWQNITVKSYKNKEMES